jgi:CRISPR-associated protein Csm4
MMHKNQFCYIIANPNGFVSLSPFVPAQNDPVDGVYKTIVKYGKLGENYALCGNPFKKPLLLLKADSVFKTPDTPKEYYGGIINGTASAKPEVVQFAYAFAVPMKYPKS